MDLKLRSVVRSSAPQLPLTFIGGVFALTSIQPWDEGYQGQAYSVRSRMFEAKLIALVNPAGAIPAQAAQSGERF